MDLPSLSSSLRTISTRSDFEKWFRINEPDLSNFFYSFSGTDLLLWEFDQYYFGVIANSKIYTLYQQTKFSSDEFNSFLTLLSTIAEKLAYVGIDSVAHDIISNLPLSPSKLRLEAILEISLVNDVSNDYFIVFPSVLDKLEKSRSVSDEEHIRPIVDVLVFYYKKANSSFQRHKLYGYISKLKQLFQDEHFVRKFDFLNHSIIIDILDGIDPFQLHLDSSLTRKRLEPSEEVRKIFSQINSEYFSHPHIDASTNNHWGFTRLQILDDVIVRGRGDFTKGSGIITAEDKVLLYCYFNMKKHFFTSYAVFETVLDSLKKFFFTPGYRAIFIDLGCGPLTSGLALADLIKTCVGTPLSVSYIGVDISIAMLSMAKKLSSSGIFESSSTFTFYTSWNNIPPEAIHADVGANNPIIINASYLFASTSLDIHDLSVYINKLRNLYDNVYFIYQNPDRRDRNIKYKEFKEILSPHTLLSQVETIRYRASRFDAEEDVSYEILKL